MFIYILNLINDNLKKKNSIYEPSAYEIINDTMYISQLAGIKKTLDLNHINDKVTDIYRVLYKYNFTNKESIEILNKLLINKNNSWILEKR